jgi:hypothetical protein
LPVLFLLTPSAHQWCKHHNGYDHVLKACVQPLAPLRRRAGLLLEPAPSMPSPDEVVADFYMGTSDPMAAAAGGGGAGDDRMDPIEAGWDDDLGKPEDTPAIDYLGG